MRTSFLNSFTMLNPEIYFQIVWITLLSGIIGFEREYHGKDAGLRTHILIGLGACAATIGALLFVQNNPGMRLDPFRITAGIITGIGFLGAGAILKDSISAKGLASAANIWITAIIGILVGSGYYSIAILITIIILINFIFIRRFKQKLEQSGKKCEITFTIKGQIPNKQEIEKILHTYWFTAVKRSYTQNGNITKVIYLGKIDRKHSVYEILQELKKDIELESISVSEI